MKKETVQEKQYIHLNKIGTRLTGGILGNSS